jgi:Mg2+/Co2+ transporter CorC
VGLSYTEPSASVSLIRALGALRGGGFLKKMRKAQPLNQSEKKYWDMAKRVRRAHSQPGGKRTHTLARAFRCERRHLSAC